MQQMIFGGIDFVVSIMLFSVLAFAIKFVFSQMKSQEQTPVDTADDVCKIALMIVIPYENYAPVYVSLIPNPVSFQPSRFVRVPWRR